MSEVLERLDELERRVSWLQKRQALVISCLRHDTSFYWTMFVLENDLTDEQQEGIARTMEYAHNVLAEGATLTEKDFMDRLLPQVPEDQRQLGTAYDFRKGMFMAIYPSWSDVYEYFKETFNLMPADRLLSTR